jgi:hypothetical protein
VNALSVQKGSEVRGWLRSGLQILANNNDMVAREGLEPPPPAFSGLDSLGLNPFSVNNLIRQGGHSFVTTL